MMAPNTGTRLTNTPARPGPISSTPRMIRELREEGRPERHKGKGQEAAPGRPDESAGHDFPDHQRKRGHEGRDSHGRQHADPRDVGPLAKADRVARVEHRRHDHHDVAAIEGERRELAGSPCAAITPTPSMVTRAPSACSAVNRTPEKNTRADENKRRDGALDDREIKRARTMRGDIEERNEDRVSGRAHHREIDPARPQAPANPAAAKGGL